MKVLMFNHHLRKSLFYVLIAFSFYFKVSSQDMCQNKETISLEDSCQSGTCNQSNGILVLSLEKAITRALNDNRQMVSNLESAIKAQYGVALAYGEFDIRFSPNSKLGLTGGGHQKEVGTTYGFGVDVNKRFPTGTSLTLSPSVLRIVDHYQTDVRAIISQPLLRGFDREYQLSNIRGAEFALRSASRSLYTFRIQLILKTINALYESVKAEKNLALNEASYQRIKKYYQAAQLKEKIGLADSLDIYRAEIELRQADDNLNTSKERLQETYDTIREILALPLDTCIQVQVPLNYTKNELCLDKAIEVALKYRIEMNQAEDEWQEKCRLARIAKEHLLPEFNIILNYNNCGRHEYFTHSCTSHREGTWGVGFSTSNDFNLAREQANYNQALIAIRGSERGIDQIKSNLTLEIKRVFRQLERAYKRMSLQEDQIQTAKGELYLAQLKFDRGMANNFDVIQAEKNLQSAEVSYWNALVDHVVGEFQFLAAMGVLTDKPRIQ
jgi:outer membrane protein TolC